MKRIIRTNIIVAEFLTVNVVLLIFPLGLLYCLCAAV